VILDADTLPSVATWSETGRKSRARLRANATFGDRLSAKAARELLRLGVSIRTGSIVTGVDAFGVDVLMWLLVHITFLTGFKNRLSAMFHWTGPTGSPHEPCRS
jgi:NADH dehydrogenase FAD-containing subunit